MTKETKQDKSIKEEKTEQDVQSPSVLIGIKDFLLNHSIAIALIFAIIYIGINIAEYKKYIDGFDVSELHLGKYFGAFIFFVICLNIFKKLKFFINGSLIKRSHIDEGIRYSIVKVTGYLGWIIAVWGGLAIVGYSMENLAIFVGALSVGIGFGLQNIVNNFVSGLVVLFERPVKKGDWILVNGQEGIVKSIRIRSTELITFDKTSVIIPNADILSSELVNLTHHDHLGRAIIKISVAYGSDLRKVQKILLDIAGANENVSTDPKLAPSVTLTEFGENGIGMDLKFVVKEVMSKGSVRSEIMLVIYETFKKEGISIPFPQREVRLINEK